VVEKATKAKIGITDPSFDDDETSLLREGRAAERAVSTALLASFYSFSFTTPEHDVSRFHSKIMLQNLKGI
jgi:hypothetical protein